MQKADKRRGEKKLHMLEVLANRFRLEKKEKVRCAQNPGSRFVSATSAVSAVRTTIRTVLRGSDAASFAHCPEHFLNLGKTCRVKTHNS